MNTSYRKGQIRKFLLLWYRKNKRPLSWRKTHHPYRIYVSEIMLQQTQVNRVEQKYPEFLRTFPSFHSLARARTADVIRAWSGMGYNKRAIHLHRTAVQVLNNFNGRLPRDINVLQRLPGIGRYTANAIACFAFGHQTAVVDTNVRRVLSRLFPLQMQTMDEWNLAEWILPKGNAYDWNQALMELGGALCTSGNPQCSDCPLHQYCESAFKFKKNKKSEPQKFQKRLPDRIYRGRIVSVLRTLKRHQFMESLRLATIVKTDFRSSENKWFEKLIHGLQRDGLIQTHGRQNKLMISLPR